MCSQNMPLPKPLRLLVLGGGAVVTELYLPALARLGWTKSVEVTDLSAAAINQTQAQHPWVRAYQAGFAEALSQAAARRCCDAVVVALPNSLHVPAVQAALNAGFPVLCEKPLAMSQADCNSLATLAEDKKTPLVAGMVRRLSQSAKSLKEALQLGLIGTVREVTVEHGGPYAWTSASGAFFRRENGGILADLGVHHLDWLGSILGPLDPVGYEDDARGGVEASCRYELKTATGVKVLLRLTHLHELPNTTTFVGDKGSLTLNRNDFATCQWRDVAGLLRGELRCEHAFDDASWPPDFLSCFSQQFVNFARVVQGEEAEAVSAREAGATMGLIERAYSTRDESHRPAGADNRPGLPSGRAVVTGGTGFIGTALVERLSQLGFKDIAVPVRGYQTCVSVARFPVQLPRVDLNNRTVVRELVAGARWVFHCALGQAETDARQVTVDATKLLLEEAEAAGVEAVVVLSTAWVWAMAGEDTQITESMAMRPAPGHYGKTKAEMQQNCLEWAASHRKTRLVILNPSCVYGPEGKTYTRMPAELAKNGGFAWVDGGNGLANYVYIDNLIDATLLTATRPEAHGKAFLATDGWCSWREFLAPLLPAQAESFPSYSQTDLATMEHSDRIGLGRVLRSLAGNSALRRWVRERWLIRKLRHRMPTSWFRRPEAAATVAGTHPERKAIPPFWIGELFGPSRTRFSNEKLKGLGWRPQVDLSSGLARSAQWLRNTHRL